MPDQPTANLTGWQRWDAIVRRRQGLVCTGLFLLVAIVFLPAVGFNFTNFDDDVILTANPSLLNGWNDSIRWAFSFFLGNWHPTTLMSHVLLYQFFGLEPWSHHLLNLLLHAANAMLLYLVFHRMTKVVWRSLLVAAIFGLHPLRVESVAWVASRTELLAMFFGLLTVWSYLRFLAAIPDKAKQAKSFYALSLVFYFLALTSKPSVITLPCVLLLLDYWPLDRWPKIGVRRLLLEKVPFFLLAVGFCFLTMIARGKEGSFDPGSNPPFPLRFENALISYCRYLGKLFYPSDLALQYPYPPGWSMSLVVTAAIFLVVVTMAVLVLRRRSPWLVMGWFWFLGTLAPMIGLIQAGAQAMADRYSYMSSIGILVMVVWGLGDWFDTASTKHPSSPQPSPPSEGGEGEEVLSAEQGVAMSRCTRRRLGLCFSIAASAIILGLSLLTHRQLNYWRSSETIWRRSIQISPINPLANALLADYLFDQGHPDKAEKHYRRALELAPHNADYHNKLGRLLQSLGRTHEAQAEFDTALKLAPSDSMAWNNMGVALASKGQLDEAIKNFLKAIEINRDDASAWVNLGFALEQKNRRPEAIKAYQRTIALQSDSSLARIHYANLLQDENQFAEAALQYREALRLLPDSAETHYKYGLVLRKLERRPEAGEEFHQALKLDPQLKAATEQLRSLEATGKQ